MPHSIPSVRRRPTSQPKRSTHQKGTPISVNTELYAALENERVVEGDESLFLFWVIRGAREGVGDERKSRRPDLRAMTCQAAAGRGAKRQGHGRDGGRRSAGRVTAVRVEARATQKASWQP